ncbi:MAG: hypothetical protein Q8M02_08055 [Candidatus Didemnitutus sp.]|nr:hypothetical protein [Candidatus Didemnitutus sp.]
MNSTFVVPLYWFKRWGWFYQPVHLLGWITSLAALAFIGHIFVLLDAQAHSVADLFYQFYVFAAPTFLGLMWIASRTCDEMGGRS